MALDPAQIEAKRGQHAAHVIVYFTRNLGALGFDGLMKMVGERTQSLLGGGKRFLGCGALAPCRTG
jgi:hypothetical protein